MGVKLKEGGWEYNKKGEEGSITEKGGWIYNRKRGVYIYDRKEGSMDL